MEATLETSEPHIERRQFPRLASRAAVQFRSVLKSQEQFNGTLSKDLSSSGLCMTSDVFLPKDSRLILLVSLPGILRPVRLVCRVTWTQRQRFADGYECGVEFVEMTPEDRQEIIHYVQRSRPLPS